MNDIRFYYQFFAVGQGLFSSGHLSEFGSERRFHWVFDCGTSSRKAYMQREMSIFESELKGEPIGLFCFSHFDEDHINGARDLLKKHRVDVLVMPYFPLVERMQIALTTPGLSEDYLQFLVDPAGYMFAAAGENLGEVRFIMGGDEPPGDGNERGVDFNPENPNDRWVLSRPNLRQAEPPAAEDLRGVSGPGKQGEPRVSGHQMPFTIGGFWEFLFFNEQIPSAKAKELRQDVANIIIKYRRIDGSFDGSGLLKELKPLYVRKFGSSGIARNRISLVTYARPVERQGTTGHRLSHSLLPAGVKSLSWGGWGRFWLKPSPSPKLSVGYFGDFLLTTPDRVRDVRTHFGLKRWNRLQIIQVPHHGSEHSWYDGAAGEFKHEISVISSARHSEHHPSQSVLDDLSTHGVVLVNEMQRASFSGQVHSSK